MKSLHKQKLNTCLIVCMFMGGLSAWAQKPIITSVDKISAGNQEIVTFKGSGFGSDATKLAVFFGASKGVINFASEQLLEVQVPSGATFDKISITHLPSGLTEYTPDNFLLSFGGEHGFSPAKLEGQKDIDVESGLYDLCSCDFDGDTKVDIATASDNSNSIVLLANTTAAPGFATISYNKISTLINTHSLHSTCGDLNGDGKADLIISEGGFTGDRLFIFQNTSTGVGSFTFTSQIIKLTGKKVKHVKIADLDLDGKPEVVVTNQSGNTLSILVNQSTPTTISFTSTPITITIADPANNIPGPASTDGLAIDDLNGDHFPEIVISPFITATSNVYILKNNSTLGNISMGNLTTLSIGLTVVNIKIGDLDGDLKADIAVTQLLGASISVFLNQSTGGNLAFSTPQSISTDAKPFGIDFGDLDGDGKTDIAIASLTKSITILNNESTPGALSFQTTIKATTFINRHVNIVDVDGDAKPDIAFTSVDDNANGVLASKISILRNAVCVKPKVTPPGPHVICSSFPLRLLTNVSAGVTYEWKNGASILPGSNPFFDVTATGNYTVTAKAEGGTCSFTSNAVSVTVDPGTTSGTAVPDYVGAPAPVCVGSTLSLFVNNVGGSQYNWTGPDGYAGTGLTPPAIANFQSKNAGRYFVDVVVGSCIAQRVSKLVETIVIPDFKVNVGGSPVACPPATKTLSVFPNLNTFNYQWFDKTGMIAGQTSPTFNAPGTGEYYVQAKHATNPSCATAETPPVKITFATTPVVAFIAPATACMGQNVTFKDQSSTDPSVTPVYLWDFGDGAVSSIANPVHKYLTASLFTVKLTVSYTSGACTTSQTKGISIQTAPTVAITSPNNIFTFCPKDSIKLQVLGSFTSYLWNTTETTSSIFVKTAGNYSVDVKTAGGCMLNAAKEVITLEEPNVILIADPSQIKEGEISQLTATGLDNYRWDAATTLSNLSIANPTASPVVTTTYHVQGTDVNGCKGEGSVEVTVREGSIYQKLKPSKFFSPDNGDEIGKFWTVEKIEEFPQCQITIYDDKGIKVFDAKPYINNSWDGTYNGKKLPDGVYYFVIKCDGEEKTPKTGSITILR
jgi:gliding motility-associated-like protein